MQQAKILVIDQQLVHYRTHRLGHPQEWLKFESQLDLSWLFHDLALEGIALSESDMRKALSCQEGSNHSEGLLFARIRRTMVAIAASRHDARTKVGPIELAAIKAMHTALVTVDDPGAGRYRKREAKTKGLAYHHNVRRPATVSYDLRKLVQAMQHEYSTMHPVRAEGLIHHDFMAIWPFDKASGAVGRLLMNTWLMRSGYPPAIIHANDRHQYYDGLASSPDATIELVTDVMVTTLRCAESMLGRCGQFSLP